MADSKKCKRLTRMEMGLELGALAMMMDDETFKRCKPTLTKIEQGIKDLYDELEKSEDDGK